MELSPLLIRDVEITTPIIQGGMGVRVSTAPCHWAGKTGQRSAVQKRPVMHYIA
jgi:NAD(P)H-dependent flavin oxidoreductase YrpB (nitropropane dioxygenase family)